MIHGMPHALVQGAFEGSIQKYQIQSKSPFLENQHQCNGFVTVISYEVPGRSDSFEFQLIANSKRVINF